MSLDDVSQLVESHQEDQTVVILSDWFHFMDVSHSCFQFFKDLDGHHRNGEILVEDSAVVLCCQISQANVYLCLTQLYQHLITVLILQIPYFDQEILQLLDDIETLRILIGQIYILIQSLIHISEPRDQRGSRMPSSA